MMTTSKQFYKDLRALSCPYLDIDVRDDEPLECELLYNEITISGNVNCELKNCPVVIALKEYIQWKRHFIEITQKSDIEL